MSQAYTIGFQDHDRKQRQRTRSLYRSLLVYALMQLPRNSREHSRLAKTRSLSCACVIDALTFCQYREQRDRETERDGRLNTGWPPPIKWRASPGARRVVICLTAELNTLASHITIPLRECVVETNELINSISVNESGPANDVGDHRRLRHRRQYAR